MQGRIQGEAAGAAVPPQTNAQTFRGGKVIYVYKGRSEGVITFFFFFAPYLTLGGTAYVLAFFCSSLDFGRKIGHLRTC